MSILSSVVSDAWHRPASQNNTPAGNQPHSARRPPLNEPTVSKGPQLFALIIGINRYKSVRPLTGAIADANSINDYLREDLNVPSDRIRNLRDQQATRTGIIEALDGIANNDLVKRGDPILIYYAGHGTSTRSGDMWMLVPQDYSKIEGQKVYGIPDRIIGELVNDIADEKGNNITIIFDCGYSGSGTRAIEDHPNHVARVVEPGDDVPPELDRNILQHGQDPKGSFRGDGVSSHILLAACTEEEKAWENKITLRGEFTQALLDTLRKVGADKISYADLIHQIPQLPNKQTPQCEGYNRHRIFFSTEVSSYRQVLYPVHLESVICVMEEAGTADGVTAGAEFDVYKDGDLSQEASPLGTLIVEMSDVSITILSVRSQEWPVQKAFALQTNIPSHRRVLHPVQLERDICVMEAGTADGVTAGAVFAVYKDGDLSQEASPLGTLIAKEPGVSTTIMSVRSQEWPVRNAFARQTKAGAEVLGIYIAKDENLIDDLFKYVAVKGGEIKRVDEERMADLSITLDGASVFFDILDNQVTGHGLNWKRIPHSVNNNVSDVYAVLRAAAHYHWHLRGTNKEAALRHKVDVEFKKLIGPNYVRTPDGPNLNVNGVINLVVDEETVYGLEIVNNYGSPLYAALFYFDSSTFAIASYYEPPMAKYGDVKPPLAVGSNLTIGYGSGGGRGFKFYLREGEDVDVGFLKLFLTTYYIDYSYVAQASPFGGARYFFDDVGAQPIPVWDSILIPVVQRRG